MEAGFTTPPLEAPGAGFEGLVSGSGTLEDEDVGGIALVAGVNPAPAVPERGFATLVSVDDPLTHFLSFRAGSEDPARRSCCSCTVDVVICVTCTLVLVLFAFLGGDEEDVRHCFFSNHGERGELVLLVDPASDSLRFRTTSVDEPALPVGLLGLRISSPPSVDDLGVEDCGPLA